MRRRGRREGLLGANLAILADYGQAQSWSILIKNARRRVHFWSKWSKSDLLAKILFFLIKNELKMITDPHLRLAFLNPTPKVVEIVTMKWLM